MNNKSWKTTLAGILGGLLITFGPAVGGRLQGAENVPPITAENYIPGAVAVVLGLLSKDNDKTGGTR